MKIFANEVLNGEPIATPVLLNMKYSCLVWKYNNHFKTVLGITATIFFSSCTLFFRIDKFSGATLCIDVSRGKRLSTGNGISA